MRVGTVKAYDGSKGMGIITPVDGGKDLIVDIKALDRAGLGSLSIGQQLGFDVDVDHFNRVFAINLRLV